MSDGLTLEKQRIAERLQSLESSFNVFTETYALTNKQNSEMINKLNHIIIGNGERGLAEKVRGLEDIEQQRKKHNFYIWCAIIGTFVTSAGKWIQGLFK